MYKIVLLGDSIRLIGYGTKVPGMLGPEYEVWQPSDNCRFASYTLRGCFDWKDKMKNSDVIHWNNGLWDATNMFGDGAFTDLDQYVKNMKRIAGILLRYSKKVIFATTTPVAPNCRYNDNDVIRKYNEAVTPELKKMGIVVNDLHTTVWENLDTYISNDLIHLSESGIWACAEQVCACIREQAKAL